MAAPKFVIKKAIFTNWKRKKYFPYNDFKRNKNNSRSDDMALKSGTIYQHVSGFMFPFDTITENNNVNDSKIKVWRSGKDELRICLQ